MEICLASNNSHKIEELKSLLGEKFSVKTLREIGCFDDIPETGTTFKKNSLLKAQYVYDRFGVNVLADDSGLEVEALNGDPGVYSARYAGEPSNSTANNIKLIENLKGEKNRNAQFRTVITLILNGETYHFDGEIKGKIKEEFNGEEGFGYNPIFIPDGYEQTFHEMGFELRHKLNHRGKAMKKVLAFLNNQ